MPKDNSKPDRAKPRFITMEHNTSRGQHFLCNPLIVQAIVEKSNILSSDTVLEIGPGEGALTAKLLEKAKKVICVELDSRWVGELYKRFTAESNSGKLTVINQDALSVDFPFFDICVANLPYQISAPFTNKLLMHRPLFRCAVLMYQREFALRLCAKPGDELYCRLSANTALLADVQHLLKVGRNNFKPPPKVESSVVRITPRGTHEGLNYIEWDGLIRLCFGRKNKTLCAIFRQKEVQAMMMNNYNTHLAMQSRPSLGHAEQGPVAMATDDAKDADKEAVKAKVIKIIEDAGFGTSRAAKLDTDQFLQLLHAFNKEGFHFS